MSNPNDGGPVVRACRVCSKDFPPKPYQVAKGDYECPACKRIRSNLRNEKRDLAAYARARYPRVKASLQRYFQVKRQTDPLYSIKRKARRAVAYAVETGRLQKLPCPCGNPKSEAHHTDYSRPLDVVWMCRRCHMKEAHRAAA